MTDTPEIDDASGDPQADLQTYLDAVPDPDPAPENVPDGPARDSEGVLIPESIGAEHDQDGWWVWIQNDELKNEPVRVRIESFRHSYVERGFYLVPSPRTVALETEREEQDAEVAAAQVGEVDGGQQELVDSERDDALLTAQETIDNGGGNPEGETLS